MSSGLIHYMPQIFYHDRKALLNVDVHPVVHEGRYKFATSSVQNEVRIWEFVFENTPESPLAVNYIATLNGHNCAVNQVKFCQNKELNLLASGDCHGRISIWQLSDAPTTMPPPEDLPPNKENWVRIKVLNHESDVTAICWSPCGKYIASVSNDDSLLVHDAVTGKRQFSVAHLRHFPNGVSWDPSGKYLVTMSTDRKMDLLDAAKGTKLRTFGVCELPEMQIGPAHLEAKQYKLFYDEQLVSFQRGGRLEVGATDVHSSMVFKRWELEKDRPAVILPFEKAVFLVKFSPIIYELISTTNSNYSGLPYRLIWLALTKDQVVFYDSQHSHPIGLVDNIHYNNLTDASWTSDGRNVIISSMEGYCSFLKLKFEEWGVKAEKPREELVEECPPSPPLIKKRVKKEKKEPEKETVKEEAPKEAVSTPAPTTPQRAPTTPKSNSLFKYLKRTPNPAASASEKSPIRPPAEEEAPKPKKRINLITLE